MAITKIITIHSSNHYKYQHLARAIPYACNPHKTRQGILTGAFNCLPETALQQMVLTKERFNKTDERQGYHFVVSFVKAEVTAETAYEVVEGFAKEYLSTNYEVVFGVHEDKEHIHGHIVCNSVSFVDGRKYHYPKGEWKNYMQPIVNRLCKERELHTIDLDKPGKSRKNYRVWANEREGKVTHLSLMRQDVDEFIKKADTYGEFLSLLKKNGYEVKAGAHISLRIKGKEKEKFRRICTCFGERYLPDAIKERIATERLEEKEVSMRLPPLTNFISCVPFQRAKLTPYQKQYYRKLYRTGQMRRKRYPNAWKYRDDIVRFDKLQEQFLYVWKQHITSAKDLEERRNYLQTRYKELEEDRGKIYQQKQEITEALELLKTYEEVSQRAMLYQAGAEIYKPEYLSSIKITEQLQKAGLSMEQIVCFRTGVREQLNRIKEERKSIRKELSLCEQTIDENLNTVRREELKLPKRKNRRER